MGSVGPNLASVGASLEIEGTEWISPNNVGHATNFTTNQFGTGKAIRDGVVQVTLDAESSVGANRKNATNWESSVTEVIYGGSSDLWGRTWSLADIKGNPTFGLWLEAYHQPDDFNYCHVLLATGFDFSSLPVGASISGVEFRIERQQPPLGEIRVRNVRCTVTYPGGEVTSSGMFLLS